MTVGQARLKALEILSAAPIAAVRQSPALDISIILAQLLETERSSLIAHPERELGPAEIPFFEAISRRASGLPVAYITGSKEFWGQSFTVTPAVLIPKPDTEILVERALSLLERQVEADFPRVLDVCTGSGCVALSLAAEREDLLITATDISEDALAVARHNARALLPNRNIEFRLEDLRTGLPGETGSWDLIVSNPPYVPSALARSLLEDGRSEPLLALDGGSDGLDLVKSLAEKALSALKPDGYLLIETGEYNAGEAARYLKQVGFADIVIHRDLAGQDRVVEGRHP